MPVELFFCHYIFDSCPLIQVYTFLKRTKMSNDELSLAVFLINHRGDDMGQDLLGYCTDLHCDSMGKEPKVKAKIVELMKYCGHVSYEFLRSYKL